MAKKAESRRSTAAQFFLEEEDATEQVQASTYDKVVELLNHATLLQKDAQKVNHLKQVQELIVHKESNLLDNFLDEMLAFQSDKSVDVRKFVIGFIEEACKKDNEILPKVIANITIMLADDAVAIQKKVIQSTTQLYKIALKWLCRAKVISDVMETTWTYMNKLKSHILALLDSDNDGIRTQAVKFMEMIVLVQTYNDPDVPSKKNNDVSLSIVPADSKILKPRKFEEEAKRIFDELVIFHGSAHISSVNLMACMGALTNIAKLRPDFLPKVVQALEALHVNLPPTLAKSQVSSVRKQLKVQFMNLLKLPTSLDFHPQITTLLIDLGATQQEISRSTPRIEEMRKRPRTDDQGAPSKRSKVEVIIDDADDDKEDDEPEPPRAKISKAATNTAIDVTAEYLTPKLITENVADIVLLSMMMLPDSMPAQFQASYTPIAAAGTENQIKHLSRLLATQFTAAGIGPGVEEMMNQPTVTSTEAAANEDDGGSSPKHVIQTVITRSVVAKQDKEKATLPTVTQGKRSKRGIIQLKLEEITKPLQGYQYKSFLFATVRRILNADKSAVLCGASADWNKMLATLATLPSQFSDELVDILQDFIFDDIRNRAALAFAWLYKVYASHQGFNQASSFLGKCPLQNYDRVLCGLLTGLLHRLDHKDREILFQRLYLEAPLITNSAIDILIRFCQEEGKAVFGMNILKELIIKRPSKQEEFLKVLLDLTTFERPEIRNQAINFIKQLHDRGEFKESIEEYCVMYLKFLLLTSPPSILFGESRGRPVVSTVFTEDLIKLCLYLYLALLPLNHKLIHALAQVYVVTNATIKRIILRVLESPVKGMGMGSPELLTLVENCPKGAETLVTRVIHILTDRAPPSGELVARVRDLYHKRVPDVRFLIPVLNGLMKKEVIAALPKLIQLNPIVVKEVFNRLLGGHCDSGANYTSPLTPAELLIALHNIDTTKCDMKTIIKATSMCFAEKQIYTQEVLAVVMQQLMEPTPLPTLLMRTVLQSLSLYPRLIGLVMNILQRLILKQVWKQKKVWEGFIKCCQRTKPQSFQVLLQLPAVQLCNVFETSPDLREPLLSHVNSFTEHQRAFIPKTIMDILLGTEYAPGDEPMEEGRSIGTVVIKQEPADTYEPAPPGTTL